eukprot:378963-Hanusia_phi.AAC.1
MGELHLQIYVESERIRLFQTNTDFSLPVPLLPLSLLLSPLPLVSPLPPLSLPLLSPLSPPGIKREYGVECEVGQPRVNYRESITKKADFDYQHKKQSGGQGQYG